MFKEAINFEVVIPSGARELQFGRFVGKPDFFGGLRNEKGRESCLVNI